MFNQRSAPGGKSSPRVCFLAGNDQTLHCGVKDYAYRLAEALQEHGIEAEVHAPADWKLSTFLKLRRKLIAERFDILHIQYPSIGFRYSLFPHIAGLTGIAPSTCVTLHEYSRLSGVQRNSTHLFALSTQLMLFTTEEERSLFNGRKGGGPASRWVVPIGSNVPETPPSELLRSNVIYFGQIRPDKGIEVFLDLARFTTNYGSELLFTVIGSCLPRHREYLSSLQAGAPENVEWILGAPLTEVSLRMSSALAAYLPFPDGASYRRGSLIGALVNSLPVISTWSAATPESLARVILRADSPEDAFEHLQTLKNSPARRLEVAAASRALGRQFSWSSIAESHRRLYEGLRASKVSKSELHAPNTLMQ
jgi:glycosyltransferase involved in cell wall biosynthesis